MLEVGKKINDYVLVRKLGAGGFGEVWQAEKQTRLSTNNFALKFFRPKEEDKLNLEKEKREIEIWQKVSGLPNIISIIEADEFEDYVYVVSEFADGGSLEKQIKESYGRAFPLDQAVTITLEILSGLKSLHQMSFVHRDIKPANILMRRGVYCLADFGISREMKAHSKSTQTAGTYEYMSPESFENKPVTVHSDIWAVGVIMQQLLTGSLPFPQREIPSLIYSILNREPENLPPDIPAGIREIIKKSLEKDPQNRFSSAAEMIAALKHQEMLLSRPEMNKISEETLVWGDRAKTQSPNLEQLVGKTEAVKLTTAENVKNQSAGNYQVTSENPGGYQFAPEISRQPPEQKSNRKVLMFSLFGGAAFLLLLALAAGAFVYKNSDYFSKPKTVNNAVSNTNTNVSSTSPVEANTTTKQDALAGAEKSALEETGNSSNSAPDTTKNTVKQEISKNPQSPTVKRKENEISSPPVVTQKAPPVEKTAPQNHDKKKNSDCIFTGDC